MKRPKNCSRITNSDFLIVCTHLLCCNTAKQTTAMCLHYLTSKKSKIVKQNTSQRKINWMLIIANA